MPLVPVESSEEEDTRNVGVDSPPDVATGSIRPGGEKGLRSRLSDEFLPRVANLNYQGKEVVPGMGPGTAPAGGGHLVPVDEEKPGKGSYEALMGPKFAAREPSPEDYDPSVGTAEYLFNQAKRGVMALPGLPGTLLGIKRQLGLSDPQTTMGKVVADAAMRSSPLGPIMSYIESEQAAQPKGEAAFLSGDYLAEKLLGAKPDMKAPSKTVELVGEGAEFMASAPFGVAKAATKGVGALAKELTKSAAIAGGAVGGGEAAQAVGGESPLVKTAGELASIPFMGFAMQRASLLTREGRDTAKRAAAQATGGGEGRIGVDEVIRRSVTERLAKGIQAYPNSIANIDEATDLQNRINATIKNGAIQLSAGRATGAPQVIADEFAARKSSADAFATAVEQDKRNAAAVLSYMKVPDDAANVTAKGAINTTIRDHNLRLQKLVAAEDQVKKQAESIASELIPGMTPEARGATLVQQRAVVKRSEDAVKNSLFGAAKAEATRIGADFSSDTIHMKARQLSANPILAYDETNLPSVVRNARIMLNPREGEIGPSLAERGLGATVESEATPKRLKFDEIVALRQAVNQDIAVEMRSTNPNKLQRMRALAEMKATIDGAIAESEHDSVKKLFGAAVSYYRQTYSPMFNKGINAKLTMTDAYGVQKVVDEKILDQYASGVSPIRSFVKLFGKNPEALAVMEDHMLDKFASAVVKDGVVDPQRYQAWVRKNEGVLRVLDQAGVKSLGRFENIVAKTKDLADRQAMLQTMQEAMAKSELAHLLGTRDHSTIIEAALKSPRSMLVLTHSLGREGSKALTTSVMRDLMRKITYPPGSDKIGMDWGALNKWLENNNDAAKIMFRQAFGYTEGAAHMQRLKDSSRMLEILDRVKTPTGLPPSAVGKDPLLSRIGVSFRTLFNIRRAMTAGRTSEADAAINVGGQSGSFFLVKSYNNMLQSIATDPEASKYLITLAKNGGKKVLTKEEAMQQAKAVSGMMGKIGYYWLGGRYYGPSLRALAPMMIQQQLETPHAQRDEGGPVLSEAQR